MNVKRGDIYYADLSPVVGSEQGGLRPVLIIQNDVGNRYSPTVIAAAITSRPMAIYYSQQVNSSKMLDLVDRLGLQDRMLGEVSTKELERVFSQEQNFEEIDREIETLRQASEHYLTNSLNSVVCHTK
jgi:hypothetical protein